MTAPTSPSTPKLSELAQHIVIPEGIVSTSWPRIDARLADMGIRFDWWQVTACRTALGQRANGRYAASVGGVLWSIARQVGKTFMLGSLLIAMCIEYPGLRVVWTSHHNRTTTNTFRSMQGMARKPKVWPNIAPNGIRTANGEQEIRFLNGSIIMFGSREQGFGRGMDALDILVFDEAQILGLKALEDMVPATNASRHPHGALIFFVGTPPRPTDDSEAFAAKRSQALSGRTSDMFFLQIGADPDADSDDHKQWRKANPSFPHRTPLESMLRMRENLTDDDSWRREALGIWDQTASQQVISPEVWADAELGTSVPADRFAVAVDVAPEQVSASVALAGQREDGTWHVELLENRARADWVPAYVAALLAANPKIRAVVLDVGTAAKIIADDLEQLKVRTTNPRVADVGVACERFVDGIRLATPDANGEVPQGAVHHIGQVQLTNAVQAARKRQLGRSGELWAWNRKDATSDITPLVACTLALWGAQNSEVTRPKRGGVRGAGRPASSLQGRGVVL